MKFLVFILSLIFTVNVWANIKNECFLNPRLNQTSSEASAVLCGNVTTAEETKIVIGCYFDERLNNNESLAHALLCSNVKSKEDVSRVINCYMTSSDTVWISVLSCK